MLKVLIVEDESVVALEISSYLESLGCEVVDIVASRKDTLKVIEEKSIDLVIMDIFLENKENGIDIALEIKEINKNIIMIFLTANSDNYNINRAIEVEPLVYLSKPFNRKELYAGINMAKRKVYERKKSNLVELDNEFTFDIANNFLYKNKELVHLTKKESELLKLLIEKKNNIVSNYEIEYSLWPTDDAGNNKIRTLIQRLRKKLNHKFIKTLSKRGYFFKV
jgi:DNA-binding response OmpR family regulator